MNRRTVAILAAASVAFALPPLLGTGDWQLPNNNRGYQPEQPVAYSHRQHAGVLGIQCQYCHSAAEEGRHATLPGPQTCMNCHALVRGRTDGARAEIAKVAAAAENGQPIRWVRVHRLPDYVWFSHAAHVNGGIECQSCHGQVQDMAVLRQEQDLSMGWCVNCHREQNAARANTRAPLDCAACHR